MYYLITLYFFYLSFIIVAFWHIEGGLPCLTVFHRFAGMTSSGEYREDRKYHNLTMSKAGARPGGVGF